MYKLTSTQANEMMNGEQITLIDGGNYDYKKCIVDVYGFNVSNSNLLVFLNDGNEVCFGLSDSEVIEVLKVIANHSSHSARASVARQKVILEHFNLI